MVKSMRCLFEIPLVLFISCGSPPLPHPSPLPSPPPPSPTPTPSPTPFPPLRANGAHWSQEVVGLSSCCGSNGWPQISDAFLAKWALSSGNLVHIRLGPYWNIAEGAQFNGYDTFSGKADLTKFRGAYWSALQALAAKARDLKVYVEIDLIDGWVMKPANIKLSPWLSSNNTQAEDHVGCDELQGALDVRQTAWVRKAVQMLGLYTNVIWQIGNENGVCNPAVTITWESSLIATVRDEEIKNHYINHMIGTNSELDKIEVLSEVNYIMVHQSVASAILHAKPTGVNEYPKITPTELAHQLRSARALSTRFDFWPGDLGAADIDSAFAEVRKFRAER